MPSAANIHLGGSNLSRPYCSEAGQIHNIQRAALNLRRPYVNDIHLTEPTDGSKFAAVSWERLFFTENQTDANWQVSNIDPCQINGCVFKGI